MNDETGSEIWVFGDYRNYFQNRVTLQLLAKARDLSRKISARVCAVVFGCGIDEYVAEYAAHGADKIYVVDHPGLERYQIDAYVALMERLCRERSPEIVLVGGTGFGREFAPRVAKRLKTGLTSDCIELYIDDEGILVQTAPAFGGNLMAVIVTRDRRPQMATVRPGMFQELPHDYEARAQIVRIDPPADPPPERLRVIRSDRRPQTDRKLEDARIVICGGRGMGSKAGFRKLFELAQLMGAEVGATRPVVYSGWANHDALVGQAGKQIKPMVLFSFGVSGAIQHTAALTGAGFVIAVNKNPDAVMMKMADVAVVADAKQVCSAMIKELRKRIRP